MADPPQTYTAPLGQDQSPAVPDATPAQPRAELCPDGPVLGTGRAGADAGEPDREAAVRGTGRMRSSPRPSG